MTIHNRTIRLIQTSIMAMVLVMLCSMMASASHQISCRYRNVLSNQQIPLTSEEEAYIKAHPTLVVAADASWRPLEYEQDGHYTGVIANVLSKLERYTGLKIKYQIMDSYADALDAVAAGKADMVSGLANDPSMAAEYNVNLTQPYLTINSSVISKNDVSSLYEGSQVKKIAVVEGDYSNEEIERKITNVKLIECESNQACLVKVQNDQADMAMIAAYCAEYYMSIPKFSSLKIHSISDFSWDQSFGVNKSIDPLLLDILNRGIREMSQTDLSEAVYQGIVDAEYDNDLILFVYKHPLWVIAFVLVVVLVFGVLITIIFMSKKKERKRQEEDATRLKMALERTHLCIWELDIATRTITKVDNKQEKHGFYDFRNNIPDSVIDSGYIHPDDVSTVRSVLQRVQQGEQDIKGSWRVKEKTGNPKATVYWWEQVLFHVVYGEHDKPVKAIGISEDVTKEKNAQRDSLTSVYNRNFFEKKANLVLHERRNSYLKCAFLILDLDGFKQINDTYGHAMGDRVLISVGATLNKTFRSTDLVGRLGGDEFTAFMTSISKDEDASRKAEELVHNINQIQKNDDFPFPIQCSVGVVVSNQGEDFSTMYKMADGALYEAKRAGKNQFRLYE